MKFFLRTYTKSYLIAQRFHCWEKIYLIKASNVSQGWENSFYHWKSSPGEDIHGFCSERRGWGTHWQVQGGTKTSWLDIHIHAQVSLTAGCCEVKRREGQWPILQDHVSCVYGLWAWILFCREGEEDLDNFGI